MVLYFIHLFSCARTAATVFQYTYLLTYLFTKYNWIGRFRKRLVLTPDRRSDCKCCKTFTVPCPTSWRPEQMAYRGVQSLSTYALIKLKLLSHLRVSIGKQCRPYHSSRCQWNNESYITYNTLQKHYTTMMKITIPMGRHHVNWK